jgi:hypothetical protein
MKKRRSRRNQIIKTTFKKRLLLKIVIKLLHLSHPWLNRRNLSKIFLKSSLRRKISSQDKSHQPRSLVLIYYFVTWKVL